MLIILLICFLSEKLTNLAERELIFSVDSRSASIKWVDCMTPDVKCHPGCGSSDNSDNGALESIECSVGPRPQSSGGVRLINVRACVSLNKACGKMSNSTLSSWELSNQILTPFICSWKGFCLSWCKYDWWWWAKGRRSRVWETVLV